MSLLSDAMEKCVMLNKSIEKDGYGGYITIYTDGVEFDAAIVADISMEARVGEAQGVTSKYTVTTDKALIMQFHDVFRRERDGKIFRVKSDGDDRATPNSAKLNMRQVEAEEWSLPTNG